MGSAWSNGGLVAWVTAVTTRRRIRNPSNRSAVYFMEGSNLDDEDDESSIESFNRPHPLPGDRNGIYAFNRLEQAAYVLYVVLRVRFETRRLTPSRRLPIFLSFFSRNF